VGATGFAGVDPEEFPGLSTGPSFCLLQENSRKEISKSLVKFRIE